jgi:hypothetical protein
MTPPLDCDKFPIIDNANRMKVWIVAFVAFTCSMSLRGDLFMRDGDVLEYSFHYLPYLDTLPTVADSPSGAGFSIRPSASSHQQMLFGTFRVEFFEEGIEGPAQYDEQLLVGTTAGVFFDGGLWSDGDGSVRVTLLSAESERFEISMFEFLRFDPNAETAALTDRFYLQVPIPVPEPSIFALGVIGVAMLALSAKFRILKYQPNPRKPHRS